MGGGIYLQFNKTQAWRLGFTVICSLSPLLHSYLGRRESCAVSSSLVMQRSEGLMTI